MRIITLNDDVVLFDDEVFKKLKKAGVRVSMDASAEKLGAKIRKAETEKVPHMFVIGRKEAEAGQVSVRSRIRKAFEGVKGADEAIAQIAEDAKARTLPDNF